MNPSTFANQCHLDICYDNRLDNSPSPDDPGDTTRLLTRGPWQARSAEATGQSPEATVHRTTERRGE
jgi:hypothetical protein